MANKLIKTFDFVEANRCKLDLTGGLRLNPNTDALEIPHAGTAWDTRQPFDTSTTLTATTWIANPLSATSWDSFSVEYTTRPKDFDNVDLFTIQFRLTDGVDEFWWDGAAWVVNTTDWNTSGEVATNLPSFPILSQKIGIVINMITLDQTVTPQIKSVKVLYSTRIDHFFDYIYESLLVELKSSLRPKARVQFEADQATDTFDLDSFPWDTEYAVDTVTAAYDLGTDPNRLTNILSSYDSVENRITLTSPAVIGDVFWLDFTWKPDAVVMTSQDYSQLAKIPAYTVTNINQSDSVEHIGTDDFVFNEDTGDGYILPGPRMGDISFDIDIEADKQFDSHAMQEALRNWVNQNRCLRSRGMDEEFDIESLGGLAVTSTTNDADIQTARLRLSLVHAVFFERDAKAAKQVQRIVFTGDLDFSVTR